MYPFFIRTGGASLLVTVVISISFSSDSFSNVSNFAKAISQHSGPKEQLVDASASNHTFVTLIAAVSKRTFRLDEPIVLSCVLSNQSVAPVTIWFSGFWANHTVTVRDASGVEPPLTTVGAMRRALFAPAGPRFKNAPHRVEPGDMFNYELAIELDKLYYLRPGVYTVELLYHDEQQPTPTRVMSPSVVFELAR